MDKHEKYIERQDASHWPTVLACCWEHSKNVHKERLFDYLVDTLPRPIRKRMEFQPYGERWPCEMPSEKFTKMYAKRGAVNLEGLTGVAYISSDDFSARIFCTTATQELTVYGYDKFWNSVGVRKYVDDLLRTFPMFHGQMSRIPIAGCRSASRFIEIEYQQIDGPMKVRRQLYMFRCYENAYLLWGLKNGVKVRTCDEMRFLTFVYTYNILSDVHLNAVIPSEDCTLREWITKKPERGALDQVAETNCIWHVPPELRESVVRGLWKTGLFPTSRHFEIVKWDSYNNLPWLAAHKSALEFLGDFVDHVVMADEG
jgi:hypothetical protein